MLTSALLLALITALGSTAPIAAQVQPRRERTHELESGAQVSVSPDGRQVALIRVHANNVGVVLEVFGVDMDSAVEFATQRTQDTTAIDAVQRGEGRLRFRAELPSRPPSLAVFDDGSCVVVGPFGPPSERRLFEAYASDGTPTRSVGYYDVAPELLNYGIHRGAATVIVFFDRMEDRAVLIGSGSRTRTFARAVNIRTGDVIETNVAEALIRCAKSGVELQAVRAIHWLDGPDGAGQQLDWLRLVSDPTEPLSIRVLAAAHLSKADHPAVREVMLLGLETERDTETYRAAWQYAAATLGHEVLPMYVSRLEASNPAPRQPLTVEEGMARMGVASLPTATELALDDPYDGWNAYRVLLLLGNGYGQPGGHAAYGAPSWRGGVREAGAAFARLRDDGDLDALATLLTPDVTAQKGTFWCPLLVPALELVDRQNLREAAPLIVAFLAQLRARGSAWRPWADVLDQRARRVLASIGS